LQEANGILLHHRHHLNASAIIKNLPESDVTFILLRSSSGLEDIAVKPLTQFPPEPYKDNPIEAYQKYKGLREITVEKGKQVKLFVSFYWYKRQNLEHRDECNRTTILIKTLLFLFF